MAAGGIPLDGGQAKDFKRNCHVCIDKIYSFNCDFLKLMDSLHYRKLTNDVEMKHIN